PPIRIHHALMYSVYTAATALAAPLVAAYLAVMPRHRPLVRRFWPAAPRDGGGPIWVHACSVGEVATARPLIERLRMRYPDTPLVLTTTTTTGRAQARATTPADDLLWFPIDQPWVVRSFVARLRPRMLVLIETELWPAILRECSRARVPVVLVNGRLSDRHFPRYRRLRSWLQPYIGTIASAGMQNALYADRLVSLGCPQERISVTGNLKFDDGISASAGAERESLRLQLAIAPDDVVLLFGSTRPGDEALAAQCWQNLREEMPRLRLIIAPRHPDRRLTDALAPFGGAAPLRSEGATFADSRVLFLDTLGELKRFYAIADVAVIGGSFFPGVDGHNPLEPAASGTATMFGPYMANFGDAAACLAEAGGARQLSAATELLPVLRQLLSDAGARDRLGSRARAVLEENRGALDATVALVGAVLDSTQTEPSLPGYAAHSR
ncbi:MAG: 3-deoxy-D-manno-octulosonic acid transferase, partial [Candidatus Hydrogenedentales bacterium]